MKETIYNSKFINDDKLRDYNIFAEEYFTSSDVKLVANGKEIKQVSAIQYELQEQLKPIYGYSSYTFDDVAVGARIVTGTIVCPIMNIQDNKTFDCPSLKSQYIANLNKENEDLFSKESPISNKYVKSFSNVSLYLDPKFENEIFKIDKADAVIEYEDSNYYYVYLINQNKFGYIKR